MRGERDVQEQFESTNAEATQAALSMGISAMNGIIALAGAMAGRGLLAKADVEFLHKSMLKPLATETGNAEILALQTRRIDELCSTIHVEIERLDRERGS
jgi:hypothetical protein